MEDPEYRKVHHCTGFLFPLPWALHRWWMIEERVTPAPPRGGDLFNDRREKCVGFYAWVFVGVWIDSPPRRAKCVHF